MGSGCLSPSPAQKDLAIFLTEQIHNAAISVNRESAYLDTSDQYVQIKQKINKMSNLKKLIDFLHSHRHKISDALAHNLKLCTQKATQHNWIKGLIILERMINMCFPHVVKQQNNSKVLKIVNNLLNNQSSVDNSQRKTEHQAYLIRKSQKENQNLSAYNYHLVDNLLNEIQNVRFQTLAMTLLRGCLTQQDIYGEVLAVLDKYLLIRSNCLQNDDKAMQIILFLFEKIGQKHQKLRSLQTYVKIISKVREKKLLGVMRQFDFFINRWIKIKSGNFSTSIKQISEMQTQVNLIEFILNKFMHCALIQLTYDPIVSSLLLLYSKNSYDVLEEFQDFFVGVLKSMDMGEAVLKFLILGFIFSGLRKSTNGDIEDLLEFNSRFFKDQTTILDNRSLQKLMLTLQRWLLQKKIVKVEEILKYHSTLFIRFFSQMLANDNKKLTELVKRIYQQILNRCSSQLNIFMNECIYGQYEKKQITVKLRSNLLLLSHLTLSKNKIHTETKIINFSLDPTYLTIQETINFYICLCCFYGKFDASTVQLYIQEICQLLSHICKLIKSQQLSSSQSSSLIKAVLDFMNQISQCRFLLAAFEQVLQTTEKDTVMTANEECMKQLSTQVSSLLRKNKIQLNYDEKDKAQNLNDKGLSQCKRYFHKMGDMALQSKLSRNQQQFESRRSIIKESCSIQDDEQQSFKDIMQMINL